MIPVIPTFLFVLTWVLVGPSRDAAATIIVIAGILTLAVVLKRSYEYQTLALIGILGIIALEGLQFAFFGLSFGFLRAPPPPPSHHGGFDLFATLFTLNLGMTLIGAVAAAGAAAYIQFGKSRMDVARILPDFKFLEAPVQLKELVNDLARLAGIQAPEVRIVDSGVPSTFTVRSNRKYSIAASVGLLESLDGDEVKACLAHEISHLKNNDFAWRFLATLGKLALFAKPLSYLIEPAVYRAREFLADRTAAQLVDGPEALVSALGKLAESDALRTSILPATICACNFNLPRGFFRIFDKHPTIRARIKALQELRTA
jgi:heat shock protein HtpX